MNIEQLNAWGAYFTAKDASEKKHGFISTWEVPSRHPWNVSEKAEFEKAAPRLVVLCGNLKCHTQIRSNATTCGEPECVAIWEGYLTNA